MAGYGDDTGLDAWLAANGYTWPVGGSAITKAVGRQRGSAYIDGVYGARFPGSPTGGYAQERAWPREDAETSSGEAIPDSTVPTQVIEASYAAAYHEALNPGALSEAVTASKQVKRVKAGSVEVEFAAAAGASAVPVLSTVEGLLAPLLTAANFPYPLVV